MTTTTTTALDFLRRFAERPEAADDWGAVARCINGLGRGEIEEAERIVGADPTMRDWTYPSTHIFQAAHERYEAATASRGHDERVAAARRLIDEAATTSAPGDVRRQWGDLLDGLRTSSLQRAMLARELGVEVRPPGDAGAALRGHMDALLAPAVARKEAADAAARVGRLYASPKEFAMTRRELPKTPPAGASVWRLDARPRRSGDCPGSKKGDVIQVGGEDQVVLAASPVQMLRDPELGLLGRRQWVLVRPATERESVAVKAAAAAERWRARARPLDDYNVGGYQTDAQRSEAEEWVRRYEADPVAAYRREHGR
jgi:hypothetical protein